MQIELSELEFENLEQIVTQIADSAGSQGLGEIERLTESALAILDGVRLRSNRISEPQEQGNIPEQTEMG